MYIRVEKIGTVEIPDGATYEEAIDYAHARDADGSIEFDLSIEVMDDDGELVTEAEWFGQGRLF
jgi:hypothetical protein